MFKTPTGLDADRLVGSVRIEWFSSASRMQPRVCASMCLCVRVGASGCVTNRKDWGVWAKDLLRRRDPVDASQ